MVKRQTLLQYPLKSGVEVTLYKKMQGYYVDFSRTFTAGYGMPGFEATEKQKKHYKLALESWGGSGELRVDGSTSDEFRKHSNITPSKRHRVAAVWTKITHFE